MSAGGHKDHEPDPSPEEASSGEDDLLTSEDLFGDLVDAPADFKPAPPKPASAARPAIKIQVAEPGSVQKQGIQALAGPREVLPEDVAALLDAFSEPGEAATRSEAAKPAAAPAPQAAPAAPSPGRPHRHAHGPLDATSESTLLGMLDGLVGEPEPAVPASASGAVDDAQLGALSAPAEALEEPPAAEPPQPAPAGSALPDLFEPEPLEVDEEALVREGPRMLPIGDTTPAPPWRPPADLPAAEEPPPPPPEPPARTTARGVPAAGLLDLDALGALARGVTSAKPDLPRPQSRTATKFSVAESKKKAGEERFALDLAALAEDALAAPPPPLARPQKVRSAEHAFGPYELLEKIAVGGMAEVFRAKRSGVEGFEKVLAVKRILPHLSDNKEFVDMFIDEAKMVAGLTHPNIVQIFDLGRLETSYYIAMEHVQGRDLRTILKRAKERGIRIPLDLSALIVSRVCAALDYAHRKKDERGRPLKIVHRDVSPQNILISFEGDVKITDFGIAKAATKATTTERGALRGKLLYMSPEQAWGRSIDRRSDVFSLGIVLYEMVTDEKPFLAGSEMSILEMVRDCRIAPPRAVNPRIPERLESVVMKALEKDPDLRYQDAAELARDLERALSDHKTPAAAELAKFMEVLFDAEERGVAHYDEHPSGEHRAGGLEVELEHEPAPRQDTRPSAPEPAGPPVKDMSIDKLLKRFGIK